MKPSAGRRRLDKGEQREKKMSSAGDKTSTTAKSGGGSLKGVFVEQLQVVHTMHGGTSATSSYHQESQTSFNNM